MSFFFFFDNILIFLKIKIKNYFFLKKKYKKLNKLKTLFFNLKNNRKKERVTADWEATPEVVGPPTPLEN
jgi:hypothetical protein